MARELTLSLGQYTDKGRKEANLDFHGALIPRQPLLGLKGVAIALADGISSSKVSGIAAQSAIKGFLTDYYGTPESWSVRNSAQRVIAATNSWLHAQTRRGHADDPDHGYVCTLTVLILRSRAAHIFHVGDSRCCRVVGNALEQLTDDHRVFISPEETWLGRALGVNADVEIDHRALPVEQGDVFVLTTDGVHEHVGAGFVTATIRAHADDLDRAAHAIVAEACARGSPDNLTIQIVRVDALPDGDTGDAIGEAAALPPPPLLEPRMLFDGYEIIREIHASHRGHVYLAVDRDAGERVAIKIPSIDLRDDAAYLRRFMMEEWIARRIDSAHVLKPRPRTRPRSWLYGVTEFVNGQTLAQWMIDHPRPDLETVRGIVEQIAAGLNAFHRKEMLHQDLRPENVMIDATGTVKIIDFGSTRVAGVVEASPAAGPDAVLGTFQYAAPEYFLGQPGSPRSDLYSLGVIAYRMLTGRLPYGAEMAKARTRARQRKIAYVPARDANPTIPDWIDGALRKAVHPDPARRHEALSEFVFELRHPNPAYTRAEPVPLIERDPLLFWKSLTFGLVCVILVLLFWPMR